MRKSKQFLKKSHNNPYQISEEKDPFMISKNSFTMNTSNSDKKQFFKVPVAKHVNQQIDAEVASQPELMDSGIIKDLLEYQDHLPEAKDRSRTMLKLVTSKSIKQSQMSIKSESEKSDLVKDKSRNKFEQVDTVITREIKKKKSVMNESQKSFNTLSIPYGANNPRLRHSNHDIDELYT